MRVHPAPNQRNITFRYNLSPSLLQKKLRRLPHIFAKVLELPFHSDADVLVQETSDSLRFVVTTDDNIGDDVRAHSIEIHPGVTKIVVRANNVLDLSMDELELDVWRFRLPAATRPDLASAEFNDGELVVIVPKADDLEEENQEQIWGERNGRLLLVQSSYQVFKDVSKLSVRLHDIFNGTSFSVIRTSGTRGQNSAKEWAYFLF